MPLLEVDDIHAGYGKLEILRGVSLRVESGAYLFHGKRLKQEFT